MQGVFEPHSSTNINPFVTVDSILLDTEYVLKMQWHL